MFPQSIIKKKKLNRIFFFSLCAQSMINFRARWVCCQLCACYCATCTGTKLQYRSLSALPQDDIVTAAIAYSYHVTYQTASHWCVWSPRRWTGLRCGCSQSCSHRRAEVGPSSWPGCCRSGLWSGCRWPEGGLPSARTLIAWSRSQVQATAPL